MPVLGKRPIYANPTSPTGVHSPVNYSSSTAHPATFLNVKRVSTAFSFSGRVLQIHTTQLKKIPLISLHLLYIDVPWFLTVVLITLKWLLIILLSLILWV